MIIPNILITRDFTKDSLVLVHTKSLTGEDSYLLGLVNRISFYSLDLNVY